jgi:hypothetical protein
MTSRFHPCSGMALAACLINDPDGPLYRRRADLQIAELAALATAALSSTAA